MFWLRFPHVMFLPIFRNICKALKSLKRIPVIRWWFTLSFYLGFPNSTHQPEVTNHTKRHIKFGYNLKLTTLSRCFFCFRSTLYLPMIIHFKAMLVSSLNHPTPNMPAETAPMCAPSAPRENTFWTKHVQRLTNVQLIFINIYIYIWGSSKTLLPQESFP